MKSASQNSHAAPRAKRGGKKSCFNAPLDQHVISMSCALRALPGPILGLLWPEQRIAVGMRVSKWLREELVRNAQRVSLHSKWVRFNEQVREERIREDLTRFYHSSSALALHIGDPASSVPHDSLSGSEALTSSVVSALYDAVVPKALILEEKIRPVREVGARALTRLSVSSVRLCHSETCKLSMVIEQSATSLEQLSVVGARLSSEASRMFTIQLSRCKALTHLELSACGVKLGKGGGERLSTVLGHCSIKHLSLRKMGIGPEGASPIALALSEHLTLLDLADNAVEDEGALALARGLARTPALSHLDLSCNRLGESEGCGVDRLLEAIGACDAMARLELGGNLLLAKTRGMASLGACTALTRLSLAGVCSMDLPAPPVLVADSASVASLSVAMGRLRGLRVLDVSHNGISPAGAETLARRLTQLASLQQLDASWNELGALGARALVGGLRGCGELRQVALRHCGVHDDERGGMLGDSIALLSSLVHLDLSENEFGVLGAGRLGVGLGSCAKLETLDLSDNQIGDQGLTALARALEQCTALRTLKIASDNGERAMDAGGVGQLGLLLRRSGCLSELDLSCNPFGPEGAGRLAGGVGRCKGLVRLDLLGCAIGDEGAGRLSRSLGLCGTLEELFLCCNALTCAGAGRLAGALGQLEQLSCLRLTDNEIGDGGAEALAGELTKNRRLRTLDLADNKIRDRGAVRLAGLLRHSASLASLNLFANEIGDAGAAALADVVCKSAALRDLRLAMNRIGPAGMQHLMRMLGTDAAFDKVLGIGGC